MKALLGKIGTGLSLMVVAASNLPVHIAQAAPDVWLGNALPDELAIQTSPSDLITNIVNLVFVLAAALTFFYLVFGAIQWITSGGDKGKVEEARNRITAAVIGLLILAATWAVFSLIMQIAFGTDGEGVRVPSFLDY